MDEIWLEGPPGWVSGRGWCRGKCFPHPVILPELFWWEETAREAWGWQMMWISHKCNTLGPTDRLGISSISQGNPWESQPGLKGIYKSPGAFVWLPGQWGKYKFCGVNAQLNVEKLHEVVTKSIRTTGSDKFHSRVAVVRYRGVDRIKVLTICKDELPPVVQFWASLGACRCCTPTTKKSWQGYWHINTSKSCCSKTNSTSGYDCGFLEQNLDLIMVSRMVRHRIRKEGENMEGEKRERYDSERAIRGWLIMSQHVSEGKEDQVSGVEGSCFMIREIML